MRWSRANLDEKQEPRAATSASAERHAEGMWHDVTRKGLTEAAIEKRTFRRSYAKVRLVPTTDIPPQRNSDRFRRPMPLSFHLNQRSSLLDRLCPSVSNTLVPFSLSLNVSTYAHTFIWRRTQWASAAVHSKTGEEISDE